jgi:hypothetical protein
VKTPFDISLPTVRKNFDVGVSSRSRCLQLVLERVLTHVHMRQLSYSKAVQYHPREGTDKEKAAYVPSMHPPQPSNACHSIWDAGRHGCK